MRISTTTASELAERLLSENRAGRSWRKIAEEDYDNQVHFATLNRIALSGGAWLPKDRKALRALGLLKRRQRTMIEKAISRMARQTKKDVLIIRTNHRSKHGS